MKIHNFLRILGCVGVLHGKLEFSNKSHYNLNNIQNLLTIFDYFNVFRRKLVLII